MKSLFSLLLFLPALSFADSLREIEVNCWNKALDEDGSFLCQYVMVMGKQESDGQFIVPELAAPDDGGPKTSEQALRACQAMGFGYALRFELKPADKEKIMVRLNDPAITGELSNDKIGHIEHLNCAD